MPTIPALGGQREEDCKFLASLGYIMRERERETDRQTDREKIFKKLHISLLIVH
jgi:hypothetical protein